MNKVFEDQCVFCKSFRKLDDAKHHLSNSCPKEKIKDTEAIQVCISYRAKPFKSRKH